MVQADLWGNATVSWLDAHLSGCCTDADKDLSLLVDLSYADIQKLQAVGAAAQAEQAKMILRNDLPKVWDCLKQMRDGRVDFVLDNGGPTSTERPPLSPC